MGCNSIIIGAEKYYYFAKVQCGHFNVVEVSGILLIGQSFVVNHSVYFLF